MGQNSKARWEAKIARDGLGIVDGQMKKLLDPIFSLVWSLLAIQLVLEKLLELL